MGQGKRAEKILRIFFPQLSRKYAIEAIENGLVKLKNGKLIKKGTYINCIDELDTTALQNHINTLKQGNKLLEVNIVDTQNEWIVVDKPAGVASNPISLFDLNTVTNWALSMYPKIIDEFGEVQPIVTPHRLDIETSGIQIVALTKKAYEMWRKNFSSGKVEKTYLAWCWGTPSTNIIKNFIAHHHSDKRKMVVVDKNSNFRGKPMLSELKLELVKQLKDISLVKITTNTGITHQIRVNMAYIGCPLVGDRLYDPLLAGRELPSPHHMLRATELSFERYSCKVNDLGFTSFFK